MLQIGNKNITRGDIYWVNLDPTIGSETKKIRPGVIVSNNAQNINASHVVIIPITSNVTKVYPFEAKLTVMNKSAKAMADQVRTIDIMRLNQYIETVSSKELSAINAALKIVLDL